MKLIIGGPGDSRTLDVPELCTPIPQPSSGGYSADCPTHGFVEGCRFSCGAKFDNCQACFGNVTAPPLITATAEICQAACVKDAHCGAFQWIGIGGTAPGSMHHQCIFKCVGAVQPAGKHECTIGRVTTLSTPTLISLSYGTLRTH